MNTRLHHIQNWPELARQTNWSAAALAKKCGVSVRTLERYFLKQMGNSPKAWLLKQRQRRAFDLIRDGSTVKEAAARIGYQHASTFSREFMKHWGCYPTAQLPPSKVVRSASVA